MKSTYKIALAAFLIGGGIVAGTVMNSSVDGASSGGQPGTADDPVVTKSYVDQQIANALKGGSSAGSSSAPATTTPTPAQTGSSNSAASGGASNGNTSSGEAIKVVELTPGKKLLAKAGAEFIVRNGRAVVYSMDSSGAIDITDGKEIFHNQAIMNNHLISFPRDDRGIQVKEGETNDIVVMVRGGYSVQ